MRCDDADVMMMQKEKQAKSNLRKIPGHYTRELVHEFRAPWELTYMRADP